MNLLWFQPELLYIKLLFRNRGYIIQSTVLEDPYILTFAASFNGCSTFSI